MTLLLKNVTVDCRIPRELADWWITVLGGSLTADHDDFVFITAGPVSLGFQRVEDVTPGKNRLHLDLMADDREKECDRLQNLGATYVGEHQVADVQWTVLADPEGNQFCVAQNHT
jgi:hypothetical protein